MHPNYINNVLKRFDELGINALLSDRDPIYGEENRRTKQQLKSFLSQSLLDLLEDVEKAAPREYRSSAHPMHQSYRNGYNDCRQQVLNILNNLKKSV